MNDPKYCDICGKWLSPSEDWESESTVEELCHSCRAKTKTAQ